MQQPPLVGPVGALTAAGVALAVVVALLLLLRVVAVTIPPEKENKNGSW